VAVFASWCNTFSIWTPVDSVHFISVPGQVKHHFSFSDVPYFHRCVLWPTDQQSGVCRPTHLVHACNMASERSNKFPSFSLPQLNWFVEWCRDKVKSVGTESNLNNECSVACKSNKRFLLFFWLPHNHGQVIWPTYKNFAKLVSSLIVAFLCVNLHLLKVTIEIFLKLVKRAGSQDVVSA
jgi:hypothetical protein